MADAGDSKSPAPCGRVGSTPTSGKSASYSYLSASIGSNRAALPAGWGREHMSQNRLAILPNLTHYDIFLAPELASTLLPFLDGRTAAPTWSMVGQPSMLSFWSEIEPPA